MTTRSPSHRGAPARDGHAAALPIVEAVQTVQGLMFRYALHELPPGRLPFRRWRWELWHGERLEAAGWNVSQADAARALRRHGSRVGHRLFGLKAPPDEARDGTGPRPGAAVRVRHGAVAFDLTPLGAITPPGDRIQTFSA